MSRLFLASGVEYIQNNLQGSWQQVAAVARTAVPMSVWQLPGAMQRAFEFRRDTAQSSWTACERDQCAGEADFERRCAIALLGATKWQLAPAAERIHLPSHPLQGEKHNGRQDFDYKSADAGLYLVSRILHRKWLGMCAWPQCLLGAKVQHCDGQVVEPGPQDSIRRVTGDVDYSATFDFCDGVQLRSSYISVKTIDLWRTPGDLRDDYWRGRWRCCQGFAPDPGYVCARKTYPGLPGRCPAWPKAAKCHHREPSAIYQQILSRFHNQSALFDKWGLASEYDGSSFNGSSFELYPMPLFSHFRLPAIAGGQAPLAKSPPPVKAIADLEVVPAAAPAGPSPKNSFSTHGCSLRVPSSFS